MKNSNIHSDLSNCLSLSKFEKAKEFLNNFPNIIDIIYDDGVFFDFAISKGNVEICKALIEYFEEKQFPVKNAEYQEARSKLVEILENATDSTDLSQEMKEVLAPYLKNTEDSVRDDLSDLPTWQTESESKDDFCLNNKNNTEFKRTYSVQDLSEGKITFLNEKSTHSSEKKTSDTSNNFNENVKEFQPNDVEAAGKVLSNDNELE